MGKKIRSIKQESLDLLRSYSWPGNIRELQNVIERAVIVSENEVLAIDESWLPRESGRAEPVTGRLSRMTPEEEKTIIEGVLAETDRASVGSFRRRQETRHPANHSGIKDPIVEDQQASIQIIGLARSNSSCVHPFHADPVELAPKLKQKAKQSRSRDHLTRISA